MNTPGSGQPVYEGTRPSDADFRANLEIQAKPARARSSDAAAECIVRLVALTRARGRSVSLADPDALAAASEFHRCLSAYASALKAAGAPPERMVIHVKRVVSIAATKTREDARDWVGQAVTWAIQAYYGS